MPENENYCLFKRLQEDESHLAPLILLKGIFDIIFMLDCRA